MDKLTFEKYVQYRPKINEHLSYWVMIVVYIISFIFSMIFSWKYFPIFQNYIFNKGNDIIFSLYATGIFSTSLFFASLVINWIIICKIFSIFHSAKNAILWYEIINSKTFDYNIFKIKNKRNNIFAIILLIISLFFSFTSLFVHLRLSDSGIYYNRIFELNAKHYSWKELKSVSVIPTVENRKNKNLSPEMILEFGENKIDIWGGAGLGSPNSEILINVIKLINENTKIKINFENKFTDEVNDLLYNRSSERKRKNILNILNILNVFKYLNKQ